MIEYSFSFEITPVADVDVGEGGGGFDVGANSN